MLTRRILRIRVMQDLYTYFVNKRAADATLRGELVINNTKENGYVYGDIFVKAHETIDEAEKGFLETINTLNYNLHSGLKQQQKCIYDNYYNAIYLLIKWVDVAKAQLASIKAYRKYYKTPSIEIFVDNKILSGIATSKFFTKNMPTKCLFLERDIKIWYNEYIKKDKFFIKYCSPDTQIADLEIIKYLIRNKILDNSVISIFFLENDPIWDYTKFIVKKMLLETIDFFQTKTEGDYNIKIVNELEEGFYDNLLNSIEKNWDGIISLVLPKLQNWDLKRIFLIDKILIAMAITEINFLNTHIAVATNEYIEISKIYSTPNSSKFINGIVNEICGK